MLWKTGTGEFSLCEKPELENFFFFVFFIGEFSFRVKRERENSRIVGNKNRRIFFFFLIREFSYCGKPESEDFFFFFNPRIRVLWKPRIGEFYFFFSREFLYC